MATVTPRLDAISDVVRRLQQTFDEHGVAVYVLPRNPYEDSGDDALYFVAVYRDMDYREAVRKASDVSGSTMHDRNYDLQIHVLVAHEGEKEDILAEGVRL